MKTLDQLSCTTLRQCASLCRGYLDEITANEEKHLSQHLKETKEVYKKYTDSNEELSVTERDQLFTAGFRLGAKTMLEIMEHEEK